MTSGSSGSAALYMRDDICSVASVADGLLALGVRVTEGADGFHVAPQT